MVLDESWRHEVLTIGGFMVEASRLNSVVSSWHALKEQLGLGAADEIKYSISEDHPSRGKLDAAGWTIKTRVPVILDCIRSLGVLLLANTLVDLRSAPKPVDLYADALSWCLRRLANHVCIDRGAVQGPHFVIVDLPPKPERVENREDLSDRMVALLENADRCAFDLYQHRYLTHETFPQTGACAPPLAMLDFAPTLTAAHAKNTDILQIADMVASVVNAFCVYNIKKATASGELPAEHYPDDNMRRIASAFRKGPAGQIKGFGFDVFPPSTPMANEIIRWAANLASHPGE